MWITDFFVYASQFLTKSFYFYFVEKMLAMCKNIFLHIRCVKFFIKNE